jgi:hypothetical protein
MNNYHMLGIASKFGNAVNSVLEAGSFGNDHTKSD